MASEEQLEELEAIQAIFMDEYKDHSKKNCSPEFTIQLVPLQSTVAKDVHALLGLRVKFTTTYPNDPPIFSFEDTKGLSDEDLKSLKKEIMTQAEELCGEVMILQLTHHIQEFLYRHNKPSLSFFEQMVQNQMKQEELQNLEQQKIEAERVAQDREQDENVIRQVEEELKKRTEVKRKRQVSQCQQSSPQQSSLFVNKVETIPRKLPFKCSQDRQKFFVYQFKDGNKKVFCSSCIGHFYVGACTVLAIDESDGNKLSLTEWKWKSQQSAHHQQQKKKVHFTSSSGNSSSGGEKQNDDQAKQIQSITQEFNYLKSKVNYGGLINYHALDFDHSATNISAKLLSDSITGLCLASYLQEDGLPLSLLHHICRQIVDGLYFLHSKSVVHHNLNLETTFINEQNEVTLSGYAMVRRICDLCTSTSSSSSFNDKTEEEEQNGGRGKLLFRQDMKAGKKGDIYNMGLIALSLYQGHSLIQLPIDFPEDLPDALLSFLKSCLDVEEDKRSTAVQLLQHSFICDKIIDNPKTKHTQQNNGASKNDHSESNSHMERQLIMQPFFRENFQGKSRLLNEFDTIEWLGKGGFGSVLKVKNKLDGNFYALKRIRLNPSNLQLNKRITREVKLLSRLNHENVVRYFNSWIEAEENKLTDESSFNETDSYTSATTNSPKRNIQGHQQQQQSPPKQPKPLEDLLLENDVFDEDFCRFPVATGGSGQMSNRTNSSWCEMSADIDRQETSSSGSESDSDEDSGGIFKKPTTTTIRKTTLKKTRPSYHDSSDGGIVFNDDSVLQFGDFLDSEDEDSDNDETDATDTTASTTNKTSKTTTSTTTATTNNNTETTESSLGDGPRSVQYLYIQMEYCEKSTLRDMINDGVYMSGEKVGRHFREIVEGLAHVHSQNIIHRDLKPFNIFLDSKDRIKIGDFGLATSHTSILKETPVIHQDPSVASSDKMTGKVGTVLYVAPELGIARGRIKFSQKVDMYSLGIILFEMCYRPLTTGMERVETIGSLRSEKIKMPEDFQVKKFKKAKEIIKWLLNHSPDERPTAQELLESGKVPSQIEDSQLDELLRRTLDQTNSTRYQKLMSTLFNEPTNPVNDQIYDSELHGKTQESILKNATILKHAKDIIEKIFIKHGGVSIEVPLLIPKSKHFDNLNNVATVMDQSGVQLCLPYDSRVSFARYVSRNNVNQLRRYYFGKLFRDQKIRCAHPIPLWECSFDIITESHSMLIPIVELMYIVVELTKEFPQTSQRNFYIQINHSNILKAIFVQNSFSEELKLKILSILSTTRNKKNLLERLQELFLEAELQDHIIARVLPLFTFEGTLSKAKDVLQGLRKTKANISNLVKQAFSDLERVTQLLHDLDAAITINICTSLTTVSTSVSGMTFQFVAENLKKKKYGGLDILAVGGCYNQLVESFSKYAKTSVLPTAVGVSIAVEKIFLGVAEQMQEEDSTAPTHHVLVCSISINKPNVEMMLKVLQELWSAGISASLFSYDLSQDYTQEEIQEHCRENNIMCFVVLKDTDVDFVRVKTREKEKFLDYRVSRKELCDYIKQKQFNKFESTQTKDTEVPLPVVKQSSVNLGLPSFFFTYVSLAEPNRKRLYESRFKSKHQMELAQYLGNVDIQVVAVSLDNSELKTVAAYLELKGSYDEFEKSMQEIIDIYQKNGPSMKRLCMTLQKVYSESNSIIVLYSYNIESYKVLL